MEHIERVVQQFEKQCSKECSLTLERTDRIRSSTICKLRIIIRDSTHFREMQQ